MASPDITVGSGTEDELGATGNLQRSKPRLSDHGNRSRHAATNNSHFNLRRVTPATQEPFTPRMLTSRSQEYSTPERMPASKRRTPTLSKQRWLKSTRDGPSITPHTVRALQKRKATAEQTPARTKRKSERYQHETPRDILRHLSKVLARTTKPTEPQWRLPPAPATDNLSDDEAEVPQPTLSVHLDELSEDDSFLAPPTRRSILSNDKPQIERSIEIARWASGEKKLARLSRGSLASSQSSENFAGSGELHSKRAPGPAADFCAFSGGLIDVLNDNLHAQTPDQEFYDEHTRGTDPMSFDSSWSRASQHRNSGLHALTDQDDGDTSFAFDIPVHQGLPNAARGLEEEETAVISGRPFSNSQSFESPNGYRMAAPSGKGGPRQHRKSRNQKNCPSLPVGVVKKLASSFARSSWTQKSNMNKDTLSTLIQAGDWFLEQIGSDLGAFAQHAGRKTIDETDVTILMKRQRKLTKQTTPFSLAQQYLPRELLQDIKMVQISHP